MQCFIWPRGFGKLNGMLLRVLWGLRNGGETVFGRVLCVIGRTGHTRVCDARVRDRGLAAEGWGLRSCPLTTNPTSTLCLLHFTSLSSLLLLSSTESTAGFSRLVFTLLFPLTPQARYTFSHFTFPPPRHQTRKPPNASCTSLHLTPPPLSTLTGCDKPSSTLSKPSEIVSRIILSRLGSSCSSSCTL